MSADERTGTEQACVTVIIAAHDAEATIGRAVASALAEPETAEVVVVDDASSDRTAAIAEVCDDGSGRLTVHRLQDNVGPSRARNLAIEASTAPLIAILDADDFFLPGRLAALLAVADWDMVADNIAFVDERRIGSLNLDPIAAHHVFPRWIDAAAFVHGSISRPDRYKGELAFLKPVMSRAFLDSHRLRYDADLRLAEDMDLYARALMAGARFRTIGTCHYIAVERTGSLSSAHGVGDLTRFEGAVSRLLAASPDDPALRRALRTHLAQTALKRAHRTVLARKREVGTLGALGEQAADPARLVALVAIIARDKLRDALRRIRPRPAPPQPDVRFLL